MYIYTKNRKNAVRMLDRAKDYLERGEEIVCFDLETMGLQRDSKILSFSGIRYAQKMPGILEETDRLNVFIDPLEEIPAQITKINHISNETVKGCPPEKEAIPAIRAWLGEKPIVCGYNTSTYDEKVLSSAYERVLGVPFEVSLDLDILVLTRELYYSSSYKLSEIAQQLGLNAGLEFHNSLDDVIASARVLMAMMELAEKKHVNKKVFPTCLQPYNPSHTVDRIYVGYFPFTKGGECWYDCYKKRWASKADLDLAQIRLLVLMYMDCRDEKDLVKAVKKEGKTIDLSQKRENMLLG